MPRIATLDLTLTAEVRAQALSLLANDEDGPTLCLLRAGVRGGTEERWSLGTYGRMNVDVVAPELESLGRTLLYEVDGLTVAIPQFQLLDELRGKTLALHQGQLVVLERERGI